MTDQEAMRESTLWCQLKALAKNVGSPASVDARYAVNEILALRSDNGNLRDQLATWKDENAYLLDRISTLQSDHDAIKNELDAVEEECTSLRNVILSQDEKLDALQYNGNLEDK